MNIDKELENTEGKTQIEKMQNYAKELVEDFGDAASVVLSPEQISILVMTNNILVPVGEISESDKYVGILTTGTKVYVP